MRRNSPTRRNPLINLGKYAKTIIALGGAAVLILTNRYGSDSQLVEGVIAVLGAIGVYVVPNAE